MTVVVFVALAASFAMVAAMTSAVVAAMSITVVAAMVFAMTSTMVISVSITVAVTVAVTMSPAVVAWDLVVNDPSEVAHAGLVVQLTEHGICSWIVELLGDFAVLVIQVAEGDAVRRTGLSADRQAAQTSSGAFPSGFTSRQASLTTRIFWMQKVHFSMTPISRVTTSGLSIMLNDSGQR
jgi:hypothetical protein